MTDVDKEIYFEFLDALRESGATNMFGARPYLQEVFPDLTDKEARKVLTEWMQSFAERHLPEKTKEEAHEFIGELIEQLGEK